MKTFFILSVFSFACLYGRSQDRSLYEKHIYIKNGDTLPYRLLLPAGYDPGKKYPLVLFLHGAGERGSDNEKQLVHGAGLFLSEDARKNYPAIVVFPQCPADSYWSNVDRTENEDGSRNFKFSSGDEATIAMKMAQSLLSHLLKRYPVNKQKVYVVGLSMGGMGTFEIVARNPKRFAAAIPICGGGAPSTARRLKRTKWWVFHGAKDNVVPLAFSEEMVEALKKVKAAVRFTVYPDANHNSWDPAFAEPGLLSWLFSKNK